MRRSTRQEYGKQLYATYFFTFSAVKCAQNYGVSALQIPIEGLVTDCRFQLDNDSPVANPLSNPPALIPP